MPRMAAPTRAGPFGVPGQAVVARLQGLDDDQHGRHPVTACRRAGHGVGLLHREPVPGLEVGAEGGGDGIDVGRRLRALDLVDVGELQPPGGQVPQSHARRRPTGGLTRTGPNSI